MPRRTKRILRRTLAIMLGLYLGWIAADVAFDQMPGPDRSAFAEAAPHASGAAGDGDGIPNSIEALTPKSEHTPWFGKVLFYSVLLFGMAAVLGPLAMSLKSPDLPDPAEQDHGHDDHAHGGGHGHEAHGHAPAAGHAAHGGHGH